MEGLKNYTESKNNGSENKISLEAFNFTKDKMDRVGEDRTQRLYRCRSN